jgi:hypothetical protein
MVAADSATMAVKITLFIKRFFEKCLVKKTFRRQRFYSCAAMEKRMKRKFIVWPADNRTNNRLWIASASPSQ